MTIVPVKIWLDDERPMPSTFNYHAKTVKEAIDKLKEGECTFISLDYDLGTYYNGTGYDVALFIEEAALRGELKEMTLAVHTKSPKGRIDMCRSLRNAKSYWMKNRDKSPDK